jgi:hypothetical protein
MIIFFKIVLFTLIVGLLVVIVYGVQVRLFPRLIVSTNIRLLSVPPRIVFHTSGCIDGDKYIWWCGDVGVPLPGTGSVELNTWFTQSFSKIPRVITGPTLWSPSGYSNYRLNVWYIKSSRIFPPKSH